MPSTHPVMIVTGGSQGIGAATARLAAARGYAVALSYRSAADHAARVVKDIRARGGIALAVQADAASELDTVRLFETVDRELGRVTALVNNAGITGPVTRLDHMTAALLDEVLGINVKGCFLALREAIARMATDHGGPGGAVVNVSSRAAALGGPGEWVHYAASKGAVDSFTIGAAKELAPRGIRVNAVNPGLIETEIHAKAGMPDRTTRMASGVPMGRAGTAEEVAEAILWLLSEQASYITGALLPIGGGR
ncbi:MAG TPA: SDR family oxidoreductase [Acetobacteraceae bacterium]|nr:SDR family oxidoreductase [Acetobacteraceae bacterium]